MNPQKLLTLLRNFNHSQFKTGFVRQGYFPGLKKPTNCPETKSFPKQGKVARQSILCHHFRLTGVSEGMVSNFKSPTNPCFSTIQS